MNCMNCIDWIAPLIEDGYNSSETVLATYVLVRTIDSNGIMNVVQVPCKPVLLKRLYQTNEDIAVDALLALSLGR